MAAERSTEPNCVSAKKCSSKFFPSMYNSHRSPLLTKEKRECPGVALGPLAPQSHALLTVTLPLENQYFSHIYLEYHANEKL